MITVLNLKYLRATVGAAALMSAVAAVPAAPPATSGRVWVERQAYLMGTVLVGRIAAPSREAGVEALEEVFCEVRRLEGMLSSWTRASEVGRLNGAPPGIPTAVSAELWALLREAERWWARTGGAFDPAVGPLVDAWGLRGEGHRPSAELLASALAISGMGHYRIDDAAPVVTRGEARGWLDTGGFGKGAALRAAEAVLRARRIEAAYLDFGGQVLTLGSPGGETDGWEIGVSHPARRLEMVAGIRLTGGSAATSSQSERFVEVDGERFGHVLDPRTGLPVPGGRGVTVVANDPAVADILSTALLVMGPDEGGRWAAELEDVGVLYVLERNDGVVMRWNTAFEQYMIDHSETGTLNGDERDDGQVRLCEDGGSSRAPDDGARCTGAGAAGGGSASGAASDRGRGAAAGAGGAGPGGDGRAAPSDRAADPPDRDDAAR